MLQIPLPAAAKFVARPVWDGRRHVLPGDTVPEVFDKLKTFGSSEFEERCKFRVHVRASDTGSLGVMQQWITRGNAERLAHPRRGWKPEFKVCVARRWMERLVLRLVEQFRELPHISACGIRS